MKRRTYSGPQPALTGGGDRPQPACLGRPEPFDALMDLTAGPAFRAAQREAQAMCAACPIAATCLRDNAREPWARAVLGKVVARPSQARPDTNQRKAAAATKKWEAKRIERLTELRELIALGTNLEDTCASLGTTRDGLYKWCRKYAREEWEQLQPTNLTHGNQHRTTDLGMVALRRGRKSRAKEAA